MTEQRIAKITEKNDKGLFIGIAEGISWTFVPKPFSSKKDIQIGNFVWVYILHDKEKDEFYLEEDPTLPFATEEEWNKQEQQYS